MGFLFFKIQIYNLLYNIGLNLVPLGKLLNITKP